MVGVMHRAVIESDAGLMLCLTSIMVSRLAWYLVHQSMHRAETNECIPIFP